MNYVKGVRPVVLDTDGTRYYGQNHAHAIASIPDGRVLDTTLGDFGHCFETEVGLYVIGREHAARLTGLPTHVQPGRLHSEDLELPYNATCENRPIEYLPVLRETVRGFISISGEFLMPHEVAAHEQAKARKRFSASVTAG